MLHITFSLLESKKTSLLKLTVKINVKWGENDACLQKYSMWKAHKKRAKEKGHIFLLSSALSKSLIETVNLLCF